MEPIYLLVAFLFVGNIKMSYARAQAPELPPGFPNFPGSFPGGSQGGFPGGSQGGFPGIPTSPQNNAALDELKRQCLANGGQAALNDFEKSTNNMQQCVAEMMPNIQSISDKTPGGICKFMHDTLRRCMSDFTKKMEPCMDKTSAYAPGFTLDMFDSVFKFLCKDDAKHIMTLMSSMAQPNSCINNLKENMKDCLSSTKKMKIDMMSTPGVAVNITKPEMCSDTKILRDCVNKKAGDYCKGDMYEFVTGISNAIYEPCSACKLFITNTFILLALLILTKLF